MQDGDEGVNILLPTKNKEYRIICILQDEFLRLIIWKPNATSCMAAIGACYGGMKDLANNYKKIGSQMAALSDSFQDGEALC